MEQLSEQPDMKIGIYDDRDVESCECTSKGDGRHCISLNLPRLRFLGNVISCAEDGGTTSDASIFQQQMKQHAATSLSAKSLA